MLSRTRPNTWRKGLVAHLLLLHAIATLQPVLADNTLYRFERNDLTLEPAKNASVSSLSDLRDGVYSIILSNPRLGCGGSDEEYLGFNNRTCSPALSLKSTAGPVLRRRSRSTLWREWMVRILSSDSDTKTVSLQAFIDPDIDEGARCLGYLSSFYGNPRYKDTCNARPYGKGLFLNGTQEDGGNGAQAWTIRLVDDQDGVFELIASNKPERCRRFVGVERCSSQAKLFQDFPTDARRYISWKFIKKYEIVTKPPPPPPKLPSPTPSPPLIFYVPPPSKLSPPRSPDASDAGRSSNSISLQARTVANAQGYKIQCLAGSSVPCQVSGASYINAPSANANSGNVVGTLNGLIANTEYSCYLIAYNAAGVKCSNMVSMVTYPASPQNITTGDTTTTTTITPQANVVADGAKTVGYKVQCLEGDNVNCDPGSGTTFDGIVNGTTVSADVTGLTANTVYSCYVIAETTAGKTCSDGLVVYTSPALGPVQPGNDPSNSISVTGNSYNTSTISNAIDVLYQAQCLEANATACDPSAVGTAPGDLTPTAGLTAAGAIEVSGLATDTVYNCFSVVSYKVNGTTKYACSGPSADVMPQQPGLGAVELGPDQASQISVTGVTYTPETAGATNVGYQVQCLTAPASVCDTTAVNTLIPTSGALTSAGPVVVSGLDGDTSYNCFSVVSYQVSSSTKYECSAASGSVTTAATPGLSSVEPGTDPETQVSVTGDTYTQPPSGATDVKYQAQCLEADASICDPSAVGTAPGDLTPTAGLTAAGAIEASGLTTGTPYNCFSVVSYTLNATTKYACSAPSAKITPQRPGLGAVELGPDQASQISVTGVTYTPETAGATNVGYQVQCLTAPASVCDTTAVNTLIPTSGALTSAGPVVVSGLDGDTSYNCFSVVSYQVSSSTKYECSAASGTVTTAATPGLSYVEYGTDPTTQLSVTGDTYTQPPSGATGVGYQVQCLESTATVCDPSATGSGELTPTTAQGTAGTIEVSGLSPETGYNCFSVVSYTVNSTTKYACSTPFEEVITQGPNAVYRLVGTNTDGGMFYTPNINVANIDWKRLAANTNLSSTACSLSGLSAAAIISSTGEIVATNNLDPNQLYTTWPQTGKVGTTVSIGNSAQGMYTTTSTGTFVTTDLATANPTVTTIPSSSGFLQAEISGTKAFARTTSSLYYIPDVTVANPTSVSKTAPAGVTAPSLIGFSGRSAAVAQGKSIYYTSDITADTVTWTPVDMPTGNTNFTSADRIYGLSLSGVKLAFTSNPNQVKDYNIFATADVRIVNSTSWDNPNGWLQCVALG